MLPALPQQQGGTLWSPNILRSYDSMQNAFTRAHSLLLQAQQDPLRLKLHIETLTTDVCPLLVALDEATAIDSVPQEWLVECAKSVVRLVQSLRQALANAHGQYVCESIITVDGSRHLFDWLGIILMLFKFSLSHSCTQDSVVVCARL